MPERAGRGSIADALDAAIARLERAGLPDPRREATTLWAAVASPGTRPGEVWLRRDNAPPTEVAERFRDAVERRSSGIPFAYAVGRASFRNLELKLDARALIPRPETEGLVDVVLAWARDRGRGDARMWGVAADVGTGCGCVALSLAVEGRFERVIAVERSGDAAALARENVALVGPLVPVEVHEGDLVGPLAGERCRVLVANPPYLSADEYAALDPAVRLFEPPAALVSGAEGLDATGAILAGAAAVLEPGGLLALEIDERRAERVRALAAQHGWTRVAIHEDLFGRPRYLMAVSREGA